MKMIAAMLIAMVLVPMARGETKTADTPAGVVSNFIREVSALATNHAELADFPEYVKRVEAQSPVEYRKEIKPFAVSFEKNTTPVLTKRRIRPSDCGTNGIFLQFSLDDGTNERQAPIDTVTYFPNLKLTFYAEVVLWEKASRELKTKLEGIIGKHKAMLQELDKKATLPLAQLPLAVGMEREKVEKLVAEATGSTSQYHVYTMHSQREAWYTNGVTILVVKFKPGAPAPWIETANGALQHLPPLDATVESWELKTE